MDFGLPSHVVVPTHEEGVAMSIQKSAKRVKTTVRSPYPFDPDLPEYTRVSSMREWVDDLPIDRWKKDIIATIQSADVTILTSDTGSGKSTRVPQFVLDDDQRSGRRFRGVVTQQRRLAAIEVAKRVASERGEHIGDASRGSVGYAVKDDVVLPCSWNSILFATEGKLLNAFGCGQFTHIFIDEAHERRIDEDALLLLCKLSFVTDLQPAKVILMTADIDASNLSKYFQQPASSGATMDEARGRPLIVKTLRLQGRRYNTQRVHVDETQIQYTVGDDPSRSVEQAVAYLCHFRNSENHIHVSMPSI